VVSVREKQINTTKQDSNQESFVDTAFDQKWQQQADAVGMLVGMRELLELAADCG
jgi:hypothetical protein